MILALVATALVAPPAGPTPARAVEPAIDTAVRGISVAATHACAIRSDARIVCWGEPDYDEDTGDVDVPAWLKPPAGTFTAVTSGEGLTCAIRTDGALACWGGDEFGLTTPPAGTFTSVSTNGFGACAIGTDDALVCWGYAAVGQVPPTGTFSAVSVGPYACAIRKPAGTLACWGEYGVATPLEGTFTEVGVAAGMGCAIRTEGTLACWGYWAGEQTPPPDGTFMHLAVGSYESCAIRADGALACWGYPSTPPAGAFTAVSSGGHAGEACAIATAGTLTCWGDESAIVSPPDVRATMTSLPTSVTSVALPVTWTHTEGLVPFASFDVRTRRAPWNGGFGPRATWLWATPDTAATFNAAPGGTYCFSVLARDIGGVASSWSSETCAAVPLDDRSLTRTRSWTAGTGNAYYQSTYLRSSSSGAKLSRTGVHARRIAVLATTCPTCGSVKVYWGSTLLRTVNLYSKTTVNRKLISIATFGSARSGTLSIKVSSSGKKVIIDGVAIRAN